jgi:Tol biopolymer transport system component
MLAGWTPKGEIGVFVESESHEAIYTVPASGGKAMQVSPATSDSFYPRWSADGERIYVRAYDESVEIAYLPAAGGDFVKVPVQSERGLVSVLPGGGLNVSPDGKQIVISAYQQPWRDEEGVDIWTIALDSGAATRLTRDRKFETHPCWSPDGRRIAFAKWKQKSEGEDPYLIIYTIPATGGEPQAITSESDGVGVGAIAYSPDGKRFAFFSALAGGPRRNVGAIKTIPVGGGQANVLLEVEGAGGHSQLAWSPDGKKIAYGAAAKIWVASVDGGEPAELQTGLPKDAEYGGFSWSRDGERIAFVAAVGGGQEFWLVSDFLRQNDRSRRPGSSY